MFRSVKQSYGAELGALDGELGSVEDFYFGDWSWAVRYVVANTGSWLTGRQVLLSPLSLGRLVQGGKIQRLKLTRQQIEESPSIASHRPVSRQYEEEYHNYYGLPYYWQGDVLWGKGGVPRAHLPPERPPTEPASAGDSHTEHLAFHLRSTKTVTGYHLQATDGIPGHVCDFMMDDQNWTIGHLVIKTGLFSGQEVQLPVREINRISREQSTVFVNLTSEAVQCSPPYYEEARAEVVCRSQARSAPYPLS